MSDHTLAAYYAAISAALRAHDIQAILGLLVLMAADGYGYEAEELRRQTGIAAAHIEEKT